MLTTNRTAAATLTGIGFLLITFGQVVIESWATNNVHLLVAIVGVVLMGAGGIWWEWLRNVEGEYDERQMAIRYRSGWITFQVLIVMIWGLWSLQFFSTWRLPPSGFALLGAGGFAMQSASHIVLKRSM